MFCQFGLVTITFIVLIQIPQGEVHPYFDDVVMVEHSPRFHLQDKKENTV